MQGTNHQGERGIAPHTHTHTHVHLLQCFGSSDRGGHQAAMAIAEAFKSNLQLQQLTEHPLFTAKDSLREQHPLVKATLAVNPKPKRTLLEECLKEACYWHHKWTPSPVWVRQECQALRSMLSRLKRTQRQAKTGERLASTVKAALGGGPFFRKQRKLHRRRSEEQCCSPKLPSVAPRTSTPGSSSSKATWAQEIIASYGLEDPHPADVVSVDDSISEIDLSSPVKPGKYSFDPHQSKVVKMLPSGQVEAASSTVAGPNGFVVGHFADGAVWESEIPNSLLHLEQGSRGTRLKLKKRPAGPRAVKGKGFKAATTASASSAPTEAAEATAEAAPEAAEEEEEASATVAAAATAAEPCPQPLLKITKGSQQSYIQEKTPEGLKLMVAISAKMSEHHKTLIDQVHELLLHKGPCTKAKALEFRQQVLG